MPKLSACWYACLRVFVSIGTLDPQPAAHHTPLQPPAGILVVKCDNRGSARRGLRFEAPLRHAFGTVEVRDQEDAVNLLVRDQAAESVSSRVESRACHLSSRCLPCRVCSFFLLFFFVPIHPSNHPNQTHRCRRVWRRADTWGCTGGVTAASWRACACARPPRPFAWASPARPSLAGTATTPTTRSGAYLAYDD